MALSLQDGTFVWQKVRTALLGANPATQDAFRTLRQYLATQGQNPQLQFVAIDGNVNASDGGNTVSQVLADTACTLYGVYLVKRGSTETIFKASANATTAAGDGTQKYAISKAAAGDVYEVYPTGDAVASGLTVTEQTTRTGTTQTLAANRFDGFVIIGA